MEVSVVSSTRGTRSQIVNELAATCAPCTSALGARDFTFYVDEESFEDCDHVDTARCSEFVCNVWQQSGGVLPEDV